jgi:hypothetical protein
LSYKRLLPTPNQPLQQQTYHGGICQHQPLALGTSFIVPEITAITTAAAAAAAASLSLLLPLTLRSHSHSLRPSPGTLIHQLLQNLHTGQTILILALALLVFLLLLPLQR